MLDTAAAAATLVSHAADDGLRCQSQRRLCTCLHGQCARSGYEVQDDGLCESESEGVFDGRVRVDRQLYEHTTNLGPGSRSTIDGVMQTDGAEGRPRRSIRQKGGRRCKRPRVQ